LETRRKASIGAVESLNTDGRIINNQQLFADTFNKYFLPTADNVNIINNNAHTKNIIPTLTILIAPYNICHKFISQHTQKLSKNPQTLLKLKNN